MNITTWLNSLAIGNQPISGTVVTGIILGILILQLILTFSGIRMLKKGNKIGIIMLAISGIFTFIEFLTPPTALVGVATGFYLIGELIYNRKEFK
jgi:membrane-bound ClpP family serine protease